MYKLVSYSLLFTLLLVLNSCTKDDDEDSNPVVTQENKGNPITFSSPQKSVFINSTDTFVIIQGGVPPYIIKDSEVALSFISNDTLFFSEFNNGIPLLKTITVSDNRSYNQSQFNFIVSPRYISLRLEFNQRFEYTISDGSGFSFTDLESFPNFSYDILDDRLYVGSSIISTNLVFEVKDVNENQEVENINYRYFDPQAGAFRFYEENSGASQNASVETNLLGIPKNLEFNLNVTPSPNQPTLPNLQVKSTHRFNLLVN